MWIFNVIMHIKVLVNVFFQVLLMDYLNVNVLIVVQFKEN